MCVNINTIFRWLLLLWFTFQVISQISKAVQPGLTSVAVNWEQYEELAPPIQAPSKIMSLFNGSRQVIYGFVPNCNMVCSFSLWYIYVYHSVHFVHAVKTLWYSTGHACISQRFHPSAVIYVLLIVHWPVTVVFARWVISLSVYIDW